MKRCLISFFCCLLSWSPAWTAAVSADLDSAFAAINREDYKEARDELERLAATGDPNAQYNLGVLDRAGLGATRDTAKAVVWFTKAADQQHGPAALALGLMYTKGDGVEKNLVEAYVWFRVGSMSGNSNARKNLYNVTRMMTIEQVTEARKLADERTARH